MKILIYSHPPTAMTGFGRVIDNLSQHLAKNHEVFILPIVGYCGKSLPYKGTVILPGIGNLKSTPKWCAWWVKQLEIDVVIQHFDIWMLPGGWIEEVNCPVITYAPVDGANLQKGFVDACQGAFINVGMTMHATNVMDDAGLPSTYIPHGVDLNTFYPLDMNLCRQELGLPVDKFIVGIVATNGSIRKNIGGQIRAYEIFAEENTILYLHTQSIQINSESFDIPYMTQSRKDVVWTDPEIYTIGVSDSGLNIIYNSFNLLLHCSLGEGFGLPIIEAQACGVPVVVNQGSGHAELGKQGGLVTQNSLPFTLPYSNTTMYIPDEREVAHLMKQLLVPTIYTIKSEEAKFQAKHFGWDNILPMWDRLLSRI